MDFDDLTYHYKPKPHHFFMPLIIGLIGYGFIYKFGLGEIFAVYLACVFGFASLCLSFWIMLAGIMQSAMEAHYQMTGEEYIPQQKTEPAKTESEIDQRWINWAKGITGGRSIARENWIGLFHPFSRGEYDHKMEELTAIKILRYVNGKNSRNGYKVNGAGGWYGIKRMSEGLPIRPIPSPSDDLLPIPQIDGNLPTSRPAKDDPGGGGGYLNTGIYEEDQA